MPTRTRCVIAFSCLLICAGCASLPAKQTATETVQTIETLLGHAQDFERMNYLALGLNVPATPSFAVACQPSTLTLPVNPTKHQVISCLFAQAFTDQITATRALQAWQPGQTMPISLANLQQTISALLTMIQGLSPQLLEPVQAAANKANSAVLTMQGAR